VPEASFADLAAIRLSQQSELVQNYLQLRVIDEQKRLLEATVATYERSLRMNENQYRAGVAGPDAVAQARTQLKSTQADLIDLIWQRAQFENAIAVLLGKAPGRFLPGRQQAHSSAAANPGNAAVATAGAPPRHCLRPSAT
jgi:Outer membrane protein